ncbi:MAG: hypothetical protein RJA70_1630 [Pseudomonadota bacterium]|jgi:membrane dipeptidase
MTEHRWPRESPSECVRRLGISREAAELTAQSDVIDLHIDSFIWQRLLGYDIGRRHGEGLFRGRFYSQVDLPRLRQVGVTGATWVITTNPLRTAQGRARALAQNLDKLGQTLRQFPEDVSVVATRAEYHAAVASGLHAAFLGIQGGNALDMDLRSLDLLEPQSVLRVTLLHLSSSRLGTTSSPAALRRRALSDFGREYIRLLNHKQILADLAHIDRADFFRALDAMDPSVPPVVTHTGVAGVYPHWRNLTDEQLRAIADRGGTVGIMFHWPFLGPRHSSRGLELVVEHIVHAVKTIGAQHVSLGSDWDGAITTPRDMRTCLELPKLVEALLLRGLSPDAISWVLGGSFLRVLEAVRG